MTAVLEIVDCGQCGWKAFREFQTRTQTASMFCPRCGYREESRPIRKRKAKAGDLVQRTVKRQGFGAFMVKVRKGVSEIGALSQPLTSRVIRRFKKSLQRPGIDGAHSFLTRWNAKQRRVEIVVGRLPCDLP
jgi:predicted RNA-binding Zn-ribbon protein involved in translation (DUF1610 family)